MFLNEEDGQGQGMQGDEGENDLQVQLQNAQDELKRKEDELSKLRSKDLNFASYRKKTEEEKREIRESMTAKEKLLLDRIDHLESAVSGTITETKTSKLKSLSGGDDSLEKEIQANFDRLTRDDVSLTPQQISERYDEAFALTEHKKNSVNRVNPLNQYNPSSGGSNPFDNRKQNFADTPEGQSLAKDLGLNLDMKK